MGGLFGLGIVQFDQLAIYFVPPERSDAEKFL
jgi:hypothetical protein